MNNETTKEVGYAYATSTTAQENGIYKTGGWVVTTHDSNGKTLSTTVFPTPHKPGPLDDAIKLAALAYAENLPHPYTTWSHFGPMDTINAGYVAQFRADKQEEIEHYEAEDKRLAEIEAALQQQD